MLCFSTSYTILHAVYTIHYITPFLFYTILYYTLSIGHQRLSAVLSAYTRYDGRLGHIGYRLPQQLYY